jgi:hypothetical protein
MSDFVEEGTYESIMASWTLQIANDDNLEFYYLRYVGFCEKTTPAQRMTSDLENRSNGFMSSLFKKMLVHGINVIPRVLVLNKDAINVTAILFNAKKTREMVDVQEQVLISLFGLNQLINSQPGGYNAKYHPTGAGLTMEDYYDLRIKFFARFHEYFKKVNNSTTIQNNVKKWHEELLAIHQRIGHIGRSSIMSDAYKKTLLRSAMPSGFVYRQTIFVMIGHDITYANFRDAKPYMNPSSSRAGYLLCDMLSRLEAWEEYKETWDVDSSKKYIGKIPYIDLIPWIQSPQETLDQGILQCNRYLNAVNPLITVAFSRTVVSVAFSNFVHGAGLKSDMNLIDIVGTPVLVSFAGAGYINDDSKDGPPDGYSTIVIPHYDPGVDKHTHRTAVDGTGRIMDLTWQITLCIAENAIDIATEYEGGGGYTREGIVNRIMYRCGKHLRRNNPINLRYLYDKLDREVERYKIQIASARSEYPEANEYFIEKRSEARKKAAQTYAAKLEKAVGEPHSPERNAQVNRLWKMNIRSCHIGYERDERDLWFEWARNVPVDSDFHMAAMQIVQQRQGIVIIVSKKFQ